MSSEPLMVGTRDFKANHVDVSPDGPAETVVVPVGTHHLLNSDHIALCEQDRADARQMHPVDGMQWDDEAHGSELLKCERCDLLLQGLEALTPED